MAFFFSPSALHGHNCCGDTAAVVLPTLPNLQLYGWVWSEGRSYEPMEVEIVAGQCQVFLKQQTVLPPAARNGSAFALYIGCGCILGGFCLWACSQHQNHPHNHRTPAHISSLSSPWTALISGALKFTDLIVNGCDIKHGTNLQTTVDTAMGICLFKADTIIPWSTS